METPQKITREAEEAKEEEEAGAHNGHAAFSQNPDSK